MKPSSKIVIYMTQKALGRGQNGWIVKMHKIFWISTSVYRARLKILVIANAYVSSSLDSVGRSLRQHQSYAAAATMHTIETMQLHYRLCNAHRKTTIFLLNTTIRNYPYVWNYFIQPRLYATQAQELTLYTFKWHNA